MYAKHPPIHDRAQVEVVEHLAAVAPHAGRAVLAHALVVEAVHLGDLPRLVVAADEGDAVGVAHLEGEEEEEGLDRVEAAVDVVACEGEGGGLARAGEAGSAGRVGSADRGIGNSYLGTVPQL